MEPLLITRYYLLVSSSEWNSMDDVRSLCDSILKQTLKEEDKYQIGLTKIFFRAGMLAVLEGLRTARLNQLVTVVQKNVRRWIELRRYRDLKTKTIKIQGWWKVVLAKRLAENMRREKAAVRIQTVARGWLARKEYARTRTAVIRIQSGKCIVVEHRAILTHSHSWSSGKKASGRRAYHLGCSQATKPIPWFGDTQILSVRNPQIRRRPVPMATQAGGQGAARLASRSQVSLEVQGDLVQPGEQGR